MTLVFCLFVALIVEFLPLTSQAEGINYGFQAEASKQTVSVSLTIAAVIYSHIEKGQLVVQTNSSDPICVLENGFLRNEIAWIGNDARIPLTEGNNYTTLACI